MYCRKKKLYPAPPVTASQGAQEELDALNSAFQELCQWLSWVPDPPLQPLRTSGLPQCPSAVSRTVPCAMLKMLCHKQLTSTAQVPQGTLLAVLLPGGTETCSCAGPLAHPQPIFSWQLKYIHGPTRSYHLQCHFLFFLVFRHTSYSHLGKKNLIQGQNFLKQKELIPSCSSPIRHTTHFSILSAPCHFVSSTDSWTVCSL